MKDFLKISLGIMAVILVVSGLFYLIKYLNQDEGEVEQFVESALYIQQKPVYAALFAEFEPYTGEIESGPGDNAPDLGDRLDATRLQAVNYRNQYNYLISPAETLDLYRSLAREAGLISEAYGRLKLAWLSQTSGEPAQAGKYMGEALQKYQDASQLRQQNYLDLQALMEEESR